jgi:hypothetical protein
MLGSVYWRQGLDQNGIMNINGALFILISNMHTLNALGVITVKLGLNFSSNDFYNFFSQTFCVELPIFLREHNNGMYRVDIYFVSKMLAEVCNPTMRYAYLIACKTIKQIIF